jgi:hypothetical protein
MFRPSSSAYFSSDGPVQRLLVREQLVVHLPELALLVGGQRRLGRQVGLVVERQRQLLERNLHLALVLILDLLHHRHRARAERALEIAERDDGDLGAARPFDGRVAQLDVLLALGRRGRAARRRRRGRGRRRLDPLLVDVLQRRPLLDQLVGLLDLVVDDLLERVLRLRADQLAPLMKNVGVPLAPAAVPASILVDLRLDLGVVPVLLELARCSGRPRPRTSRCRRA